MHDRCCDLYFDGLANIWKSVFPVYKDNMCIPLLLGKSRWIGTPIYNCSLISSNSNKDETVTANFDL
jgi:hypothetical protein